LENKVETKVSGKNYVGFFSDTNKYNPTNGTIAMGTLYLKYTGSAKERVTFSEVRVHTVSGTNDVTSKIVSKNTEVEVTRAKGGNPGNPGDPNNPGNPGNPGDGSGDGGAGGDGSGNSGTGSGGSGNSGTGSGSGGSGTSQGTGTTAAQAVVLTTEETPAVAGTGETVPANADKGGQQGTEGASANTGSDIAEMGDEGVPLAGTADGDAGAATLGGIPVWLIGVLAAIAAAVIIVVVVLRNRKKQTETEGNGDAII
jgi:hypothetical protein